MAGPSAPGRKGQVEACLTSRAGGLWPELSLLSFGDVWLPFLGQVLEGRPPCLILQRTVFQVRSRQLAGPGERRVQPTVAAERHLDLGCGCQVPGHQPPCLARPTPAAGGWGRMSRGTGWAWRSSEASHPRPGRRPCAGTALGPGTPAERGSGRASLLGHRQAGWRHCTQD